MSNNQAKRKPTCYIKVCKSTFIVGHGLCNRCYASARYLIRTGQTTWEELESEEMNLAKPKRTNTSPLLDAFMAIKRKAKTSKTIFTKRIK